MGVRVSDLGWSENGLLGLGFAYCVRYFFGKEIVPKRSVPRSSSILDVHAGGEGDQVALFVSGR